MSRIESLIWPLMSREDARTRYRTDHAREIPMLCWGGVSHLRNLCCDYRMYTSVFKVMMEQGRKEWTNKKDGVLLMWIKDIINDLELSVFKQSIWHPLFRLYLCCIYKGSKMEQNTNKWLFPLSQMGIFCPGTRSPEFWSFWPWIYQEGQWVFQVL
jgi:hypothetical protein